ncbi:hypothetical protein TNCV_250201 [Trichonephila clavipes]|nr:hypothetical protein TNCV_250201 [Trichonephila clavipes]
MNLTTLVDATSESGCISAPFACTYVLNSFELRETKLPVRLINTANERKLVQGHETPPRKQRTQQLETRPGCEEAQKKSIRSGPESVVANRALLGWDKETKLTPPGVTNVT